MGKGVEVSKVSFICHVVSFDTEGLMAMHLDLQELGTFCKKKERKYSYIVGTHCQQHKNTSQHVKLWTIAR